jgi:hypothetical protein
MKKNYKLPGIPLKYEDEHTVTTSFIGLVRAQAIYRFDMALRKWAPLQNWMTV